MFENFHSYGFSRRFSQYISESSRSLDLAGAAYRLLAGLDPSRQRLGYVLPSKLPNGMLGLHGASFLFLEMGHGSGFTMVYTHTHIYMYVLCICNMYIFYKKNIFYTVMLKPWMNQNYQVV